jgi:hypothetical protein
MGGVRRGEEGFAQVGKVDVSCQIGETGCVERGDGLMGFECLRSRSRAKDDQSTLKRGRRERGHTLKLSPLYPSLP